MSYSCVKCHRHVTSAISTHFFFLLLLLSYSACKSLQNLLTRLDLKQLVKENTEIVYSKNPQISTLPLKSIVLDFCVSRENEIESRMAKFMNDVIRKSVRQLQCLWAPLAFKDTGTILVSVEICKNMITWVFIQQTSSYKNILYRNIYIFLYFPNCE